MNNNEIESDNNGLIELNDSEVEVLMSKEKAMELTEDIQSTTTALYILLKRAHDEKAWVSMGYKSWSSYIENEFEFSRARSYQLINQANVIEVINEASGVPLYLTERDARSITKRLPEITEKLEAVKKEGLSPEETKEKAMEAINTEYEEEVDNSKGYNGEGSTNDGYAEEQEDNSAMEEWKPDGIDMEAMRNMLSEDDKFYYENLLVTLEIFDNMPNATEFGLLIKKSNEDKAKLINLCNKAKSWIEDVMKASK